MTSSTPLGLDALEQTPKAIPKRKQEELHRPSLNWLCHTYFASAAFRELAPRTRYVRRLVLERLCEDHGRKPYAKLEPHHVAKLRDAKAARPEAANADVKARRVVSQEVV